MRWQTWIHLSPKRRTKDSETVSGTAPRGSNVEDEVDGCSIVQNHWLTNGHDPTRTGKKDSESVSVTGLRGGNVEDEARSTVAARTVQDAELTVPSRSGTMDRETLSATGRKQFFEGAMSKTRSSVAASSRTTSWPWPLMVCHRSLTQL